MTGRSTLQSAWRPACFPEKTMTLSIRSLTFSAEKRRVALHSMLAAAVMTLLKLAAGLLSGSLGVLSDAAHSGLDLVGSALTFFSVQVSDKPADEDHTYGHGKFENFSSFGEVLLMAVSSAWIIWEAIQRILHPAHGVAKLGWPARWCSAPSAWTTGGRGGCATWPSAPARRRWPPTPFTLPRTSGRRWRCCAGWAPVGRARTSASQAALRRSAGGGGGFAADFAPDAAAGPRGGERAAG
jgi:hypothetical protein